MDNDLVNNDSISDELTYESKFHDLPTLIPKNYEDDSSDDDEDNDDIDGDELDEDDNSSILNESIHESIPESIAHCLPNVPNTSTNNDDSNNRQNEDQLDMLRAYLDKECYSSKDWQEPLLFNARYCNNMTYDKIDITQFITSDYPNDIFHRIYFNNVTYPVTEEYKIIFECDYS